MNTALPPARPGTTGDDPALVARRVLVVDDDELVCATLAMQLESDGVHVATAATIDAAHAALKDDPKISVVVCDIHLAHENGFDLAEALAALRPERLATEIVFITGDATSDTAIEALRRRAFDLIRKPMRRSELIARVSDAHRSATRRRQRQARLDQIETRLTESEVQKQRLMTALHDAEGQNRAYEESTRSAQRDLLAVISHELKTPLIPIVGLSDIILTSTELSPAEVREFAGMIRDGGDQLGAIIDRTLSYLDVENQHAETAKGAFAVADLITEALRDLPGPDVVLTPEIRIDCTASLHGWGAHALLAQALREVAHNAIKASPAGGTVGITARTPDAGRISVRVTDNGPGLPGFVRNNLGMPFLKNDCSASRHWHGVGIGLARAKKIAQLSGGDISFGPQSADGGAEVILTLRRNAL